MCRCIEIGLLGALAQIAFDCIRYGEFTVKLCWWERYIEFGTIFALSVLLIILKIYHRVVKHDKQ